MVQTRLCQVQYRKQWPGQRLFSRRKMKINGIAAFCNNRGIGKDGGLPWRLKKEMAHFQKVTKGSPPEGKKNVVVMGRKTWQEIGKPLKGRYNIVMSRSISEKLEGMDALVHSLKELEHLLSSEEWTSKAHEVFNIGGAEIYKVVMNSALCGRLYITQIMADFECDTFFPEIDDTKFLRLDELPEDVAKRLPSGEVVEANGVKWKVEVYDPV